MNTLKYLKKHYNIVIFLLSLLVIGIILGVILGFKQDSIFQNDVVNSLSNLKDLLLNRKINCLFNHLLIFGLLIISSFIVPLYFINFIFVLFKGITIGFSFYLFCLILGFKGFILALLYNLLTSGIFCLIYIFLIIRGINISKNVIAFTLSHEKNYLENIKSNLYGIIIVISVCLLFDTLLFIFSNPIRAKLIWLF